ncbi:helix-turn-helix domain-containing protein [Eubacterium multiforme]|uniref:Transcriptional regulator with XRE-family HTH domain n=1 Tax=Eubacterium multiforme TaxID=83339 RepID=A0ABT9US70_9FIRM|nr:XRE family transcriptional regulator [Eubacterium multiforme]MDQ0149157.1 transcriptional regulator with XRE-family HTH domain [Eubacterium multiforme]
MDSNILGKRLKLLRTEAGLTQEEFGKKYALKKSTISQYESGFSRPDDELKKQIAIDYNVSIDWLLGLIDSRKSNINESSEELLKDKRTTVALHNGNGIDDELPEEAKKEIENFIEFVKNKYGKK